MANPETCLHNVVGARVTEGLELVVNCFSCGADMSSLEKRVGKNYKYDHDYHVWVHIPDSRAKRTQARTLTGGVGEST